MFFPLTVAFLVVFDLVLAVVVVAHYRFRPSRSRPWEVNPPLLRGMKICRVIYCNSIMYGLVAILIYTHWTVHRSKR